MQGLKPIYSETPDALVDARGELRGAGSGAALPAWLNDYQPLAADLRAQAATLKSRPVRRCVALKVVLIDESAPGRDRLGQVIMEQVADEAATGGLYAADTMAGVITDDAWRGALDAALGYARECRCGIAPGTDVRWSVRVLQPGEKWEDWEDTDENKPRPLKAGQSITGRSAGVAFFLGLFALAQGEGAASGWHARKVVESIVALATLPETETRASVDPLGTLGGAEKRKLEALRNLPEDSGLIVVFPSAFAGTIQGRHVPLPVTTVGGLFEVLRERCGATSRPDSLPVNRGAGSYIGGGEEVERMKQAFSAGGWHIVTGPGGVGKTARVIEATAPLWNEGLFRGGRFWIDFYGARETGRTADIVAAGAIATACGKKREEKLEDLRTQARDLLGLHRSLVLLEGAETVPEREIAAVLELFPSPATVVWMTRRDDDAQHPSLRRAVPHSVQALSPAHALELLCHAAGREVAKLPAAERPAWEEIAEATQRLPLLLGWAGEALRPYWGTTAVDYLAELYADPLGAIADPHDREMHNAGRFLRRSLARIAPTAEMSDLPVVAERLFAGLAAFDPSYGAPLAWWPLAAGLNTTKAAGQRRFIEARRQLWGLGLVTRQVSLGGAKAIGGTVHVVHALAGTVATDMWREQASTQRAAALAALCQAATAALEAPLPPDWFRDASWIAGRTAEGAHYGHWVGEMEASDHQSTGPSFAADALREAWAAFLDINSTNQRVVTLQEAAWTVVCRHLRQMVARTLELSGESSDAELMELQRELVSASLSLGLLRMACQDLAGAEEAYMEAKAICEGLATEHPDDPGYQNMLWLSWNELRGVRGAMGDWAGADKALEMGLVISRKLANAHPEEPMFQRKVAISLDHLGRLYKAVEDWTNAERSFDEARRIRKTLVEAIPDEPLYHQDLAVSWGNLGDLREARSDWPGAEVAFARGLGIRRKLASAHPEELDFQSDLASSWDNLVRVRKARRDWPSAGFALNKATGIRRKLAEMHPDMPLFQEDFALSWDSLGELRQTRQDLAGAEEAYMEAKAIRERVATAHPDTPLIQTNLAHSWMRLGTVRTMRKNWEGAEKALKEKKAINERLATAHPEVPRFQGSLANSYVELGDVGMAREDWGGAEMAFDKAVAICKKLAAASPGSEDCQWKLSFSWHNLGKARKALHNWTGAEMAFTEAISLTEELASWHPNVLDFRELLAMSLGEVGVVRMAREDWGGAEEPVKKALELSMKLVAEQRAEIFMGHVEEKSAVPRYLEHLVVAWERLHHLRKGQNDQVSAEAAFHNATTLKRELEWRTIPDPAAPVFMDGLVALRDCFPSIAEKTADDDGPER